MEEGPQDTCQMTSQQALCDPAEKKTTKHSSLTTLKLFIVALSFSYFSKALTGTYMKSSITQIERRFDLSSTHIGLIDGSFEMGNLLFLAVVSHFGAQLHRPRLIAVGCFLMSVGTLLTGLTHFFMGRYKYDTVIPVLQNDSSNIAACMDPLKTADVPESLLKPPLEDKRACVQEPGSHMWIYVFLGNALRGIGETPVTPLGISYIDDFAKPENSPFYIACLQTITLLGPMFGFLLGSYCANLYVDIGFVHMDTVTITVKDARWVGAWWLGFLVSSALLFISSIPFWFLPRSLPKPDTVESKPASVTPEDAVSSNHKLQLKEIAKGFVPSLRRLLGTPAYFLLLCASILKFNSFIGLFTFKAKYMEQQFGQSASRANFLIGMLNLPAVAVGIFLGGLLMRRYKLSVVSGAQLSFATSFMGYLLLLLQFGTKCDNIPVAGLTVSYNGTRSVSYNAGTLFSECNRDCSCSADEWDPVCADSGITYISPCMAGCLNSSGYGKNTVFHNCSCVSTSFAAGTSSSVKLGQCPHAKDCSRSFTSYMAVSVLSSFINSLGATPGYMVIIRCISPELKSLALGIQALVTRTLGGIPAPVYFGALIDSTCLKWSVKKCGGKGACRLYESDMYRVIFLGLITCLSGSSYFFMIAVIVLLRRQFRGQDGEKETQRIKASKDIELQIPSNATEGAGASTSPKLPDDLKVTTDCDKEEAVDRLGQPSRDNESKRCTQTTTEFTLHVTDEASKDLACWEAESQQEINHTEERSKVEKRRQE